MIFIGKPIRENGKYESISKILEEKKMYVRAFWFRSGINLMWKQRNRKEKRK